MSVRDEANVLLIRHGAVDYGALKEFAPVYNGTRYDFAPLSDEGVRQVDRLLPSLTAYRHGLVVSSPYTRTLQTAAILSAGLQCRLTVDLGVHDWLPERDGQQPVTPEVVASKIAEYGQWKTTGQPRSRRTWETDDEMRTRLLATVGRHRHHGALLIVTHEAVIKSTVGANEVPLASVHALFR